MTEKRAVVLVERWAYSVARAWLEVPFGRALAGGGPIHLDLFATDDAGRVWST